MLRWLKRLTLLLVLLCTAALLAAWWLLRGSLPALHGEGALPGLSAPVVVARDALGTVTIDAASERDALRALGYVHAQERYFEMDLMRRTAAGELSALFGPIAVETDRRRRVHRIRARVEADLQNIAGERMPQLRAYAEGVNAGREALRVRPWPYLLLRRQPEPWRPADSALTGFAMYFDLQDAQNARELALLRMRPHLPPALYALLTHDGSRWDAPLAGEPRGDAPLPGPDQVDLRTLPTPGDSDRVASRPMRRARAGAPQSMLGPVAPAAAADLLPGSNSFAVAGTLTADGRAIVANDMHLGLRAPNIWFRARLRYPDPRAPGGRVDISGFTLPGLPAVVVGSNAHVAWGFTNSYIDTLDWSRVRPCAAGQAPATPQPCEPIVLHQETIEVAGDDPVAMTVEETAWGPILHREPDGTALALRWAAHQPGALNLGLLGLAHAADLDDALAVADRTAIPTQNLLVGDRGGRIAWRLLGPVARRDPACDPAATACAPWDVTTGASPLLASPTADRLWTANTRVLDGEPLRRIGDGGYALGIRAHQIREGLLAGERFGERDLLAIQLDDRAVLLDGWWQLLRSTALDAGGTPALRELADAAERWEGRASVDSTGYRIVRAWRLAVHERIAEGLTAPARAALGEAFEIPALNQFEGVAWPLLQQRPAHLLPRGYGSWTALMEDAAAEVRAELLALGPMRERTWGERNTAAICHPLAGAIPLVGRRLLCMPPEPLPGDGITPRVQGPAFGASQRMVVAAGREQDAIAHMPGGQSGHPLSPFWGAGHRDWVEGAPTPFLPGETVHSMRLRTVARD
ncbi:penicillin acylase family protein [Luteimonas sp. RD2P54]|uniref:Penicillin acylase family protein n=1 Tax=Luteimonas endophytica TaxID=3042023 RepID=A0ABT6J8H2_9GAMM|nr:penicillin acylase family protein [Luteimonas endophytica]MDH5823113.1 penicillin acylase family protein [Luteimonas endophytica]